MNALAEPEFQAVETQVFANLGCGPRGGGRTPAMFTGWRELRVDADAAVEPDIQADLVDLSAIESGSVQGVWSSHCLEHLFQHQVADALLEMRRILSSDGFACIAVPDLQTIAGFIAADRMHETIYTAPAGPITPHDVVFGYGAAVAEGRPLMGHRCGFTPSVLTQALDAARFGQFIVLRRPNFELIALAHKSGWASATERDRLIERLGL
jgi:SAM-dependent methyltransferase